MPVAVIAIFWGRDKLSAGRAKSLMPARTMLHCPELNYELPLVVRSMFGSVPSLPGPLEDVSAWRLIR